jgi:hypothetical protein
VLNRSSKRTGGSVRLWLHGVKNAFWEMSFKRAIRRSDHNCSRCTGRLSSRD